MITDYKVVQNSDSKFLEDNIRSLLQQGWKPQGGVTMSVIVATNEHYRYAQAMIKETP